MHVFRFVGIACLALAWTLCASLVNAAPILYSRVQVSAQNQDVVGFPVARDDSGTVNNVDTIPARTAAIGLASASAFVTDGVLGAKASAGSLNVGGIQGQTATGSAGFVDTLTLVSSSLSAGTTVTLRAFIGLTATTGGPSNRFLGCGQANGNLSRSVPGGSVLVASAQETNCVGVTNFNNAGTITAAIGDDVTVQASLVATAFGRAGGTGSVDAAQTMRMFLIPMGDFTYTTLSGNSYLQSSPTTPGQPGRPQVTVTGGVVTVAWTPPATGTATQSYSISVLRDGAPLAGSPFTVGLATNVSGGPLPAGTYELFVTAVVNGLASPPSEHVFFTIGSGSVPGPPTLTVSAVGNVVSANWSPGPGGPPTSYFVTVGTSPGRSDVFASNVGLAPSGSGSLPDGTYYVRVTALNAAGSAASIERQIIVTGSR